MGNLSPEKHIISVNREFALLIESETAGRWWCSKDIDEGSILDQARAGSEIVVPYRAVDHTPFQYEIFHLLNQIDHFWDIHRNSYIKAISELQGLTLLGGNPLKHGLYFDTILIDEVFTIHLTNPDIHKGSLGGAAWIRSFVLYYLELFKIDSDVPIVAINLGPKQTKNDLATDYEEAKVGIFKDQKKQKSEYNTLKTLNKLSRPDFSEFKTTLEWRRLCDLGEVELSKVFYLDELLKLVNMSSVAEANVWDPFFSQVNDVYKKKRTWVDGKVYKWFIKWLYGLIYQKEFISERCHILKADPLITSLQDYKFWLELESENTIEQFKLDRNLAAPLILNTPKLKWLGTISLTDVIRFREKEGAKFLKSIFESNYKKIKHSTIDSLPDVLDASSQELTKAIEEHNLFMDKEKDNFKKEIFKSGSSFLTTLGLSLVSVFAPPLAVVSIPAAIFSSIIGCQSLIGALNNHITGKENLDNVRDRPVGILAKYYD